MTFFHFGNCVALAYVPYIITYKFSGLSEYSTFYKCVYAGCAYLFTQLVKMMILATFFPTSESPDVKGEFFKTTVDIVDLVGLHLVMSRTSGKAEIKFLVAGVGWATAELIMTRFIPLWVGARGIEFDWKYIQMSLDSNLSLLQYVATATLVWLWSRNDLQPRSLLPVIVILLGLSVYRTLIVEIISEAFGLTSWALLLLKSLITAGISLLSLKIFLGHSAAASSSYSW